MGQSAPPSMGPSITTSWARTAHRVRAAGRRRPTRLSLDIKAVCRRKTANRNAPLTQIAWDTRTLWTARMDSASSTAPDRTGCARPIPPRTFYRIAGLAAWRTSRPRASVANASSPTDLPCTPPRRATRTTRACARSGRARGPPGAGPRDRGSSPRTAGGGTATARATSTSSRPSRDTTVTTGTSPTTCPDARGRRTPGEVARFASRGRARARARARRS
mmetsp:Transcript_26954/g.53838  ORF Transcript_26954/g.53838 Transcript_26954/m.53838 type:complete len:219 (+) Transcript_26954:185-841(+)